MKANGNSKALLEALCANADPRKARSLRIIHAICEEQRDRGSGDYSFATIGRLSSARDGPAAGAIRNKTGEPYRALIKVFADTSGGKLRKPADADLSQVDLVLEGITDPVLR
ncbi:MAG: gamma-mobile-trio protein GmtX, partial [Bradyrhizobium sp.]